MVHRLDKTRKNKKHKEGLMEDKDYITEAWLQGGKGVGEIVKPKKKKQKKNNC